MFKLVRRVPLHVKLLTSVLVLVGAAVVVISVGSAVALHHYLMDRIDGQLNTTSTALRDADPVVLLANLDLIVLPSETVVAFSGVGRWDIIKDQYLSNGDLPRLPDSRADALSRAGRQYTTASRDNPARWRVLNTARPDGRVLIVAQSMSAIDSAITRLVWVDAFVGGAVLIVLAALGAAIVRTSLRPLTEIERTAGAIARGDLTQRVPDPEHDERHPHTELGRLSRALNTMLTQIEAAFSARAASEAAARQSEQRMRQFVADASHELRTPLTTIRGFAELHRQGAASAPGETDRLVRRIEDEASRMSLLVRDLLLLARLDQERPVELTPVELRVLAADAVQAARAVAPARSIELEVAADAGPLVVNGDDGRLRQVLGNLMTNALTHTPPDASVTLRLHTEADTIVVVEVVDTGRGLSAEQAERVFERFYRADTARTRRTDGTTGTGLGLAIVAALIAAHRGSVEVDSTPGQGTTFRVRLPLAGTT
jgi:two-component system OmpR family sensor kinase